MKGKKFIIRVFATIMIGVGFLLVTGVACSQNIYVPKLKEYKVEFPVVPGKKSPVFTFRVDKDGCVEKILRSDLTVISPYKGKQPPWPKEIKYFGSLNDSQCREGVIAIEGSPIEYWWDDPETGDKYCLFAYCPDPWIFYEICPQDPYRPSCP